MNDINKNHSSDNCLALIGVQELERLLGMTRHTFHPIEKAGEFPSRIAISYRHVCYRKSDIEEYLEVIQSGGTWSEHMAEKAAAKATSGVPQIAEGDK